MAHSQGFLELVDDAKTRIREITLSAFRQQRGAGEGPLVFDVREDHEWEQGRIPGASHLGKGILERDIEGLVPDKEREIVLYCGGGFRSALAADNLQKMGYENVLSLAGGFRGWREAGGGVER